MCHVGRTRCSCTKLDHRGSVLKLFLLVSLSGMDMWTFLLVSFGVLSGYVGQ